ncbi:alpha/beta fold hydrolase [Kiloniella sp. EL199]|uniref:alpha/beta fold hydrolase n=1 Tax=Kiloniella sp. EL199 TaxID=2107581 RepID=UPI0013C4E39D|nr:alpha/beta hydrolase [Kiloniella sp. EL199]
MNPVHKTLTCADGVTLGFQVWGENNYSVILMVHGLGSNHHQFDADAELFSRSGYCCVVPDMRGHGDISPPDPLTFESISVKAMADDLLLLCQHMGKRPIHLVGNSMGGVANLALLEIAPEKISSLTTFGTAFSLNFPPFIPILQYAMMRLLGTTRMAKLVARSATSVERTKQFILTAYPNLNVKAAYTIQKSLRHYDYRKTALEFQGPIQIIRGSHDKSINRYLPETIEVLEGKASFVHSKVENAGHFANLDQPEKIQNLILDFIKQAES